MVHSWFIMKRDSKIVHPPMSLAGFFESVAIYLKNTWNNVYF